MLGRFCHSLGHFTADYRTSYTIENSRINIDDFCSTQVIKTDNPPDPLDPGSVPAEFKREQDDMVVVYNPEVSRSLDVELMDTLYFDR